MPFVPAYEGQFPSLGPLVGQHIEQHLGITLLEEQAIRLFHLYRVDRLGHRVIRRAALRRPKGFGKSPEGAYIGFAELTGPVTFAGWDAKGQPVGRPHPSPWVQFAAVSADQTDNVLVWLYETLADRPSTLADLAIDLGRSRIYLRNRPGRIEPVTAAAGSREGQPITFGVLDQTESWRRENGGVRLASTLRRNAAKTGGWTYELQNAPEPGDGSVAEQTSRAWERGQAGVYFDTRVPTKVPDLNDRPALLDALAHVYGESASRGFVGLERLADECVDPDTDPADAYRFYLNTEWVASSAAFDEARWAALANPALVVSDRSLVVAGVDGARFDDALAIVATEVVSGHQFPVGIWERPEHAGEDYEHPVNEIDGAMTEFLERFDVWRVYVDPQWIDHLFTRWQGRWGDKRILPWYTNRPRQMGHALRRYRSAQVGGDLSHDGDGTFARHMRNARRKLQNVRDDQGRPLWTLAKPSPQLKIDAAMAGGLSWEARSDAIAAGAQATKTRSRQLVSW